MRVSLCLSFTPVALAALLGGCGDAEVLVVTFGTGKYAPPVEVDTRCDNGGCDGSEQIEVRIKVEDDAPGSDAEVEILQYRVDYSLFSVEGEVPYYANVTSVRVAAEEPAEFNVRAAGQRQRDRITSQFGYDQIDGIGTLTLAGYDQDNEIVLAEAQFDILFGDFVDDTGSDTEMGEAQ
jgi:hypothetical protein